MKEYKYDIAISLCKEDVSYAKYLVNALNPKLDVFFYEDRQEQLIGELGPEVFGDVFKHKARVVVILYRRAWGESYYTELERAAILDRTGRPDQGQSFIMVIGMEAGAVPGWYPSSRIYANPMNFTVEKLAEFIEYKVNERGGNITPPTFEEIIERAEQKRKGRKDLVNFLQSTESRDEALSELNQFVQEVNKKIESLGQRDLGVVFGKKKFNTEPHKSYQTTDAHIMIGHIRLAINLQMTNVHSSDYNSQLLSILAKFEEMENQDIAFSSGWPTGRFQPIKTTEYKYSTDRQHLRGWAEIERIKEGARTLRTGVFLGHESRYDLKQIIPTESLVDSLFRELFRIFEKKYPVNY